jgi:hypothetical protein
MLAPDPPSADDTRDQPLALALWKLPKPLHAARITFQVSDSGRRGKQPTMLRKLLWSTLYTGLAAGFALAARQGASAAWRLATGESPPAKR